MGLSPSSRGSIRGVVLPSVVRIRPGRILVPVTRLRIILIFRARIAPVLIFPPPTPHHSALPRPHRLNSDLPPPHSRHPALHRLGCRFPTVPFRARPVPPEWRHAAVRRALDQTPGLPQPPHHRRV